MPFLDSTRQGREYLGNGIINAVQVTDKLREQEAPEKEPFGQDFRTRLRVELTKTSIFAII